MTVSTVTVWAARDRGAAANAQMREHVYRVHRAASLTGARPGTVRCAYSGALLAVHRDIGAVHGLPIAEVDRVGACEGTDRYERGALVFAHPYVNGTLRNGNLVGPDAMARARAVANLGYSVDVATERDARKRMRGLVAEAIGDAHKSLATAVKD